MVKFKIIRPFIIELLTFIFVICGIFLGLLAGNYIEIIFHINLFTIGIITIVVLFIILYFSRVVNIGVKALIDFIFQQTKQGKYIFIRQLPYQASIFTEKFGPNHKRSLGMYYLIQVKNCEQIYTFISPSYVELEEGKVYIITSARSSHILLYSSMCQ